MKLIFEEGEFERMENGFEHSILFDNKNPDRIYSINFKVTNCLLAEYVMIKLLTNDLEDFDIGIELQSVNLNPIPDKQVLKQKIHQAIDRIIG